MKNKTKPMTIEFQKLIHEALLRFADGTEISEINIVGQYEEKYEAEYTTTRVVKEDGLILPKDETLLTVNYNEATERYEFELFIRLWFQAPQIKVEILKVELETIVSTMNNELGAKRGE